MKITVRQDRAIPPIPGGVNSQLFPLNYIFFLYPITLILFFSFSVHPLVQCAAVPTPQNYYNTTTDIELVLPTNFPQPVSIDGAKIHLSTQLQQSNTYGIHKPLTSGLNKVF